MELKRLDAESLQMVLDTLQGFAIQEMPLEKRIQWDHDDVCPEEVIRAMMGPDVGLHLVFIPEEYDGMGGGAYDVYRLSMEFAKIDLGLATSMLAVALGIDPIRVGATPEQKQKWMPKIANEGLVVAYAVTEPEAGSNLENLKTTAERIMDDAGNVTHYKINGVKQFISNGSIADLYTVLVKAPEGPTFFAVERSNVGIRAGQQEIKHGIRLSNTAQVVFDDVLISAKNLIGTSEGQGLKQANAVFGFTRLMVAAFGLGGGLSALEKAIDYSKERKQFGTLLCEKQGYTHKLLVPNSVRLAAARAYIEHVAYLLDTTESDLQIEGSIAKLFATESGNTAAEDAIQALGGYGYCAEYEVEKIKRDTRILMIYEGTSEIQQNIIGVFRMRQNVKRKGKFYNDMADEVAGLEHVGGAAVALTQVPEPRKHNIHRFGISSSKARAYRNKSNLALCSFTNKGPSSKQIDSTISPQKRATLRKRWAHLIRCVYLTDPLICPDCGGKLRVIAFITELGKNLEGDLAIELRVEGEDPAHHEALSSLQARRISPRPESQSVRRNQSFCRFSTRSKGLCILSRAQGVSS